MELYAKQQEVEDQARAALRYCDSVMIQAATGFGKTVLAAHITKLAQKKGSRVIFSVHRKNLLRQTSQALEAFDVDHGYIAAGMTPDRNAMVNIASIDTLQRRLERVNVPNLFIVDEAHMAAAKTWRKAVHFFRERGAKILGLSATPARLDGKPLSDMFDDIVLGPPVRWLMDNGYLSDYIAYAPSTMDLSGVHTSMGDFAKAELAAAVDKPRLIGDAVSHYRRLAPGTRAICYCVSIAHSQHTAQAFNGGGVPAAHIDGETQPNEQRSIIQGFADGRYQVLCNAELITTGFDLSAQVGREVPVETIILLRPTQSQTLFLQMVGRGLRRKQKPAVILDHSGNMLRHGLPDDEREWTLEGQTRAKKSDSDASSFPVRQCERCYHVHRPAPKCPKCGFVYAVAGREIEEVAGELRQVDPDEIRRLKAQERKDARTLAQLRKLGEERGYHPRWAEYVYNARMKRLEAA